MRTTTAALLCSVLSACKPDNPPITQEIRWADAETEALVRRACYDCHSNETDWKFMHSLPGVKGWVGGHVYDGRCALNFSEWDRPQPLAVMAAPDVRNGRMPMETYTRHRKRGRLTVEEQQQLADGITRTLAADPPLSGEAGCTVDTGAWDTGP